MSLLASLLLATAHAAPMASVSVGKQSLPADDCIQSGVAARASVLWHAGAFAIGPVVQTGQHNVCYVETLDAQLPPSAVGDFHLIGLGPQLAAPSFATLGPLTLGAHIDVLADWATSPVEESYYDDVLHDSFGGIAPPLGTRTLLIRAGGGLDVALPLDDGPANPELVASVDGAYHIGHGVASVLSIGLRVNGPAD